MNGGYLMVSKSDTNLYAKLNNALTVGKPILWYEDENTCYYIDTITKSGTDIVLTKGGKTITLESDGDITETGDASSPTMENIKDLNGNLRFVEGDININVISGVEEIYGKWSLSGTHLMIVLSCKILDNTVLSYGRLCEINLPDYILNKISTINNTVVERKTVQVYGGDLTSQSLTLDLIKDNGIFGINNDVLTLTADRVFKVQFDLLIDAE